MELKVGDRIKGKYSRPEEENLEYTGIVFSVSDFKATVKRDDGKNGSGENIEGYGDGWLIKKNSDNLWYSDASEGSPIEILLNTLST